MKEAILELLNNPDWSNEYKAEFILLWIDKASAEGRINGINSAFDALKNSKL